ncbi:hypothetical protein AB0C89_02350 [Streptomyces sp. NPDC048491]|uniref:trypsin-like serine peptidase n=1 Tax=Streptomyces sp. NPDC048491 TaxID=3157207 RepID=UPI0034262A2C
MVVSQPGIRGAAEQQRVAAYWTSHRMALAGQAEVPPAVAPGADDLSQQDPRAATTGQVWGGKGQITKSVGRLFRVTHFVNLDNGNLETQDRSCTATVVKSPSRSTVVTAAHCMIDHPYFKNDDETQGKDTSRPVWDTGVYFVPGYRDGAQPMGGFTVRTAYAAKSYLDHVDMGSDVAMLTINPAPDGRPIAAVTGAQNIAFNTHRIPGQFTYNFGYYSEGWRIPGQGTPQPWETGQLLGYCAGPVSQDIERPQDGQWGMRCDLKAGSSGGPHLLDFDHNTNTGTVVGVNSSTRTTDAGPVEDAAPLDSTAMLLYARAQTG